MLGQAIAAFPAICSYDYVTHEPESNLYTTDGGVQPLFHHSLNLAVAKVARCESKAEASAKWTAAPLEEEQDTGKVSRAAQDAHELVNPAVARPRLK